MRPDMFKVIVERPRRGGSSWSRSARGYWNSEEVPAKLGIRRGHTSRKWLNEHLGPLRRFLVSQAGRPWNAVFSEICAVIDTRSTVKQHVRSHIEDFVAIDVKLIDGKLYGPLFWGSRQTPLGELFQELYVDPETGLLLKNIERIRRAQERRREAKRRRVELEARRRILSDSEQFHLLERIWYRVDVAALPAGRKEVRMVNGALTQVVAYDERWDVVLKAYVCRRSAHQVGAKLWPGRDGLYGRPGLYAVSKRQLGTQEMRRHGLRRA